LTSFTNQFYSITTKRIRIVAESLRSLEPSPEATPSPPHVSTSTEPDIFSLLPTKRNIAPVNTLDRKPKRTKTDPPKKTVDETLTKKEGGDQRMVE